MSHRAFPAVDHVPAGDESIRVLRAYLERAPVPSAVVSGAAHAIVFANAAFRQLSERVGAHAGVGTPAVDALPSAAYGGLDALLDRVRLAGAEVHDVRLGLRAAGELSPDRAMWRCDAWPVIEDSGGTDYLVVTVRSTARRDRARSRQRAITERLVFAALREHDLALGADKSRARADTARQDAEDANQVKTSFLTSMSHELRTPLNAILGYTDLIAMGLRGPVTEEQRDALSRIRRAGRHLLGLINNVLNFARLRALQARFTVTDGPASDLLDSATLMVEPQASEKGLSFERLPAPPTLTVHGDHEKVLQVLLNLLSNAIKFTEPGGRVTLAAAPRDRRRPAGEAWPTSGKARAPAVEFTVTDTGRGIAPEQIDTLFEPFVQVGLRLAGVDQGTGLGLAISRDLARAMGGDVTVESTLGVGSTFSLIMPSAAGN